MVADAVAWICRTPVRLLTTLAVVVLVAVAAGTLLAGGSRGADTPRAAASATPAAAVPDAAPYVTAAVAFVRQWAVRKDGETARAWHDRVAPLATPDFAAALTTTDPDELPGSAPAGTPTVKFVAQDSGLVAVPLAGGDSVLVTVVGEGSRWLVSDVQPDVGDAGDVAATP